MNSLESELEELRNALAADLSGTKELRKRLIPLVKAVCIHVSTIEDEFESVWKKMAKEIFTPLFRLHYPKNDRTRSSRQSEFCKKVFLLVKYCRRQGVDAAQLHPDDIDDILIAENFDNECLKWQNQDGEGKYFPRALCSFLSW